MLFFSLSLLLSAYQVPLGGNNRNYKQKNSRDTRHVHIILFDCATCTGTVHCNQSCFDSHGLKECRQRLESCAQRRIRPPLRYKQLRALQVRPQAPSRGKPECLSTSYPTVEVQERCARTVDWIRRAEFEIRITGGGQPPNSVPTSPIHSQYDPGQ